jgi:hypothetical protein
VDTDHIGMMGHSLGGSAALGIGRQRDEVNAVIALEAPFLYDIVGVEDGEFVFVDADYPTPVLNVYSDDLGMILLNGRSMPGITLCCLTRMRWHSMCLSAVWDILH